MVYFPPSTAADIGLFGLILRAGLFAEDFAFGGEGGL
jgi:hypothetical protein